MPAKPGKRSLEQLLLLVDQLSAEDKEMLRVKLNLMATSQTSSAAEPFPDWHINIDSLAKQQGVPEKTSVDRLKGDFWPADEDLDEFVTALRQWRAQSSERK